MAKLFVSTVQPDKMHKQIMHRDTAIHFLYCGEDDEMAHDQESSPSIIPCTILRPVALSQIEEGMTSAEGQMRLIDDLLAGAFNFGVEQTAQQETRADIEGRLIACLRTAHAASLS